MSRKRMTILGTAGLLVAAVSPLSAHHAFGAEFDSNKPVTLEGKVVKMEWSNPHTWLYVDVEKDGKLERWAVEGGAPGVLLRNGFKRDSFPEGTKVIVHGFAAKDESLRANSRSIEFPDGRKLDTGSSFNGGKEK
jgi:Family of unknown function (DUF6152)